MFAICTPTLLAAITRRRGGLDCYHWQLCLSSPLAPFFA